MRNRRYWWLLGAFLIGGLCWASPLVAQVTLEVMNPQAEIPPPPSVGGLAPRVGDLAGKRIGLISNNKPGAELFLTEIEELLKAKVPATDKVARFIRDVSRRRSND